ncbi:MAG: helix-turn-helix transcriptional regulator, partial [Clostridia bacterium]|nr:helix-turn-helix transcriptional regulator [Clostridia bacterium]
MNLFAENLKKFRKLAGLRQDDIAKVIGLDRSAYAYYETGKTEP